MINPEQIITPAIPLLLVLFGTAILSGLIENVTKRKRNTEDNIKVIIGLIIGIPLFAIIFTKLAIFIGLIILVILIIRTINIRN